MFYQFLRGLTRCFLPWHLSSQTVSLLIPLENDIGRQRSCVAICFLVIVPPVQVVAEWKQSETRPVWKWEDWKESKRGHLLKNMLLNSSALASRWERSDSLICAFLWLLILCFFIWGWWWDTYRQREEEKVGGGGGAEGRQPSTHLPNLLLCVLSRRMGEDGCGKG